MQAAFDWLRVRAETVESLDQRPCQSKVQSSGITHLPINIRKCPATPVHSRSCSDLVFYWISSEKGVFCCHLVRAPWSLIQFKETAGVLHATSAGQQDTFLVFLSVQQPSLMQFQVEFHHTALRAHALTCCTLVSPSGSSGARNKWLKTRSDWVP